MTMKFLSQRFLILFFSLALGMLSFASAQETNTASQLPASETSPPAQEEAATAPSPQVSEDAPHDTNLNSAITPSAAPAPLSETNTAAAPTATAPEVSSSPATEPDHNSTTNTATVPSSEPASSVTPTDPSLIPQPETPSPNDPNAAAPAAAAAEEAPEPVNSTESIEKKKHELKVRYYEVRTQVEKDQDVAALKKQADKASTNEGKRQALRAYYELLFTKMKKIDSSISDHCDTMQAAYMRHLEQIVVEPTIPLPPPLVVKGSANDTNETSASIPESTPKNTPHKKKSN